MNYAQIGFLVIGTLGVFILVMLFGESVWIRNTPIGWLYRYLNERLPGQLTYTIKLIIGVSNYARIARCCGYIMNDKHPLVQIFYLALITGGLGIFFNSCAPHIPNKYISNDHWYSIWACIIWVYFSFYLASTSDPGYLDRTNVKKAIDLWIYDRILYDEKFCNTCLIDRPARSKHCSVCKRCISKLDHHCVWINNCVGHLNHRWFIMFLVSTATYCTYGSYLFIQTLRAMYDRKNISLLMYIDSRTGARIPASTYQTIMYMVQQDPLLGATTLFAPIAAVIVIIFLNYQLYLIMIGQTSNEIINIANESFKWDDLGEAIATRHIKTIQKSVLKFNQEYKPGKRFEDYQTIVKQPDPKLIYRKHKDQLTKDLEDEEVEIKSLKELKNIYNLGIITNLGTVFFPPPL